MFSPAMFVPRSDKAVGGLDSFGTDVGTVMVKNSSKVEGLRKEVAIAVVSDSQEMNWCHGFSFCLSRGDGGGNGLSMSTYV
jgi:hypothetical protein